LAEQDEVHGARAGEIVDERSGAESAAAGQGVRSFGGEDEGGVRGHEILVKKHRSLAVAAQ
jgi:hypothetical protein